MPYIDRERRVLLSSGAVRENVGELTYVLQQEIKRYLKEHRLSYATMAEILGALDGARLDFYVRVVQPYEQEKTERNGDVWD